MCRNCRRQVRLRHIGNTLPAIVVGSKGTLATHCLRLSAVLESECHVILYLELFETFLTIFFLSLFSSYYFYFAVELHGKAYDTAHILVSAKKFPFSKIYVLFCFFFILFAFFSNSDKKSKPTDIAKEFVYLVLEPF